MVQQDVCQLGTGVQELQQHAQDVVHQRVLVQGVLDEAQHWDDAALPEGGDVLHFLQLQAGNTQGGTEQRPQWISSPLPPSWGSTKPKVAALTPLPVPQDAQTASPGNTQGVPGSPGGYRADWPAVRSRGSSGISPFVPWWLW